ncbi:hypothetical protein HaLaN_28500, partial [Haematococcus lacustris]
MPPKRKRKRPVSPAPSAAGASGSGGQGQAGKEVTGERRQVIKAAFRGLVEAARPELSPAEVDAVVAEVNKRMTMGSKQCVLTAVRTAVIKAAFRGLVEAARPDLSPAEVDAVVAEVNKRMTMGSKQCVLTAVLCLSVLLQSFLGQPSQGFPAAGPAPGHPLPPDPACPPYAHPCLATRSSPRCAAAPAQLPPPVQLNIWDPQLLAQIKDAMELLTNASVLEHMMRGPHHHGFRLLPGEVAVFEQPSSAWPVAMLKQLDDWVSRQHYHQERGVAVYLGAGNFSQGGGVLQLGTPGYRGGTGWGCTGKGAPGPQ